MDWYDHLPSMVASPQSEVTSTEIFAVDGQLARHLDTPAC